VGVGICTCWASQALGTPADPIDISPASTLGGLKGRASLPKRGEWLAGRLGVPKGFASEVEPFGRAVAARAAPIKPPSGR